MTSISCTRKINLKIHQLAEENITVEINSKSTKCWTEINFSGRSSTERCDRYWVTNVAKKANKKFPLEAWFACDPADFLLRS